MKVEEEITLKDTLGKICHMDLVEKKNIISSALNLVTLFSATDSEHSAKEESMQLQSLFSGTQEP